MRTIIFILISTLITASCTTEEINFKIKNDPLAKISFTYPEAWEETLTYRSIKIDNLSLEKDILIWENEPISAQEEAKREQSLLTASNIVLPQEDTIAGEIQRKVMILNDKIPALIKTHFGETNDAERWLRFYKDDWQITIIKTLPITQQEKNTESVRTLSTEILKEESQKILTEFEAMVATIKFY